MDPGMSLPLCIKVIDLISGAYMVKELLRYKGT